MKKHLLFALSIAAAGLLFSNFVFAQDDKVVSAAGDQYIISAKAGGVNYVEGKVVVVRKDGKSGYLLKSDKLEIGDKVSTGADGKAEILLNPGSFARLGANAEFEFVTTDLENLKLKLSGGSAIFEVYADDEFKVSIDIPKAAVELTKSGVYRIDVLADGTGKLSVWKGKVLIGDDKAELKSGKSAILSGKSATIAKFDRDNKDDFDIWSQTRAKEAAKINAQLRQRNLKNSLVDAFNRGGWNYYNSFGIWVYDLVSGRWCFLPFGQGWNSPYGYGYGYNIWNCGLPPYVYTQPTVTPTTTPTTTPTAAQIREQRREDMHTPTFQRFENNQRSESRGGGNNDSGSSNNDSGGWNNSRRNDSSDSRRNDSNDSRPTYTPPAPSAPSTPSTPPIITPPATDTKTKDN